MEEYEAYDIIYSPKKVYAPPYVYMEFRKERRADDCIVTQPFCKDCKATYDLIKYGNISIWIPTCRCRHYHSINEKGPAVTTYKYPWRGGTRDTADF